MVLVHNLHLDMVLGMDGVAVDMEMMNVGVLMVVWASG